MSQCPRCQGTLKLVPAGLSKAGKPYQAFWACNDRNCGFTQKVQGTPRAVASMGNVQSRTNQEKETETAFGKCKTLFLVELFKKDITLNEAEIRAEAWASACMRKLTQSNLPIQEIEEESNGEILVENIPF